MSELVSERFAIVDMNKFGERNEYHQIISA